MQDACPRCCRAAARYRSTRSRRDQSGRANSDSPAVATDRTGGGQVLSPQLSRGDPRRFIGEWPAPILILVPLLIGVADSAILLGRRAEPVPDKAIRLVKESSSPIESFSIQQYLNGTLYYRKERDSSIRIQGWTAHATPEVAGRVSVEFGYSEGAAIHLAHWNVDVATRKVSPDNADAASLSWMK